MSESNFKSIAFVFDTNFIIQNKDLKKAISELKEEYTAYITQVSIEERKAQKFFDMTQSYEKLKKLSSSVRMMVSIKSKCSIDEAQSKQSDYIQKEYDNLFGKNIIPFDTSTEVFEIVLQRALYKKPPFRNKENASDKGFKDCLMWISIMQYFKSNGEKEIVFLTNDDGFIDQKDILINEFQEFTGKKISIERNTYFSSLIKSYGNIDSKYLFHKKSEIPNIEVIREKINNTFELICFSQGYDYWGNEEWSKTFYTNKKFDSEYLSIIFERLEQILQNNIFNQSIKASSIFDLDDRITDNVDIDINLLEKANNLYKQIKQLYPEHMIALFNAIAHILNQNYKVPIEDYNAILSNEEVPF